MILAKRPRSDTELSSGLNRNHGRMHATTLIAVPMVSQSSRLLPKQPFEQAYTSHLVTFSVRKISCISALCFELGPSPRFFKVPTVGAPSGVVLGNYIGNSCMGLIVHANWRWRNRYDNTHSYMICIILCIDICKMAVYLHTFLNSNIFVRSQSRQNVKLEITLHLC